MIPRTVLKQISRLFNKIQFKSSFLIFVFRTERIHQSCVCSCAGRCARLMLHLENFLGTYRRGVGFCGNCDFLTQKKNIACDQWNSYFLHPTKPSLWYRELLFLPPQNLACDYGNSYFLDHKTQQVVTKHINIANCEVMTTCNQQIKWFTISTSKQTNVSYITQIL